MELKPVIETSIMYLASSKLIKLITFFTAFFMLHTHLLLYIMPSPATYFTRPSNVYRPAVLSSIESLELGALQGLLWLKSGDAPMNENSLVNCNNDIATTTTHETTAEDTIDESTLILHPKKKKKINRKSTAAAEKKIRRTVTPENLPTFGEVDDAPPTTLHSEEDKDYINPIHTIIRKDIIEVFVDKSDKAAAGLVRFSFKLQGPS